MDTRLLKALSDPNRLKIVELLMVHPYCVKALALRVELSESAISQHLKVLREAGLVEGVKYGYYTHYRVNRELLSELRAQLDALIALTGTGRHRCDLAEEVCCAKRRENEGGISPC